MRAEQTVEKDTIYRQAAIDALWKALFEYEDKTEKQFLESDELDISDWMLHRIFVQNMSDIDRETILNLPSAEPERKTAKWIVDISNYKSVCSVCGADETEFIHGTEMWYGLGESKCCPNCGAYMISHTGQGKANSNE